MTAPIPTQEPDVLTIGDTWHWQRFFSSYMPSDGWVLTYYFKKADASFSIVCTTVNGQFDAYVAPAATATYKPGRYRYFARVSNGTDSYILVEDEVEALNDPSATGAIDYATTAQKIVVALEQLALRRAGGRQTVSIGGVHMIFDSQKEIQTAKTYWEGVVESEQNQYRIKKGLGSLRTIRFRL